jgi:hypothetical protein
VEDAAFRVLFWLYMPQKIPGMEQTGCFQKGMGQIIKIL